MRNDITVTNVIKNKQPEAFKPAELDFIDIEKRLKELKELEKALLIELEQY
ncbi:MAG: hypothetical protein AB1782_20775 [Cyanobacteriota bacterium]